MPVLTDKVRLSSQGKLPPDYLMLLGHPQGIDGHFLRHFGLDMETAIEAITSQSDDGGVEQWFRSQSGVTEDSIPKWNHLAPNLGRRGWPGEVEIGIAIKRFYGGAVMEHPVETLFELIRIDEKFAPPPSQLR